MIILYPYLIDGIVSKEHMEQDLYTPRCDVQMHMIPHFIERQEEAEKNLPQTQAGCLKTVQKKYEQTVVAYLDSQ